MRRIAIVERKEAKRRCRLCEESQSSQNVVNSREVLHYIGKCRNIAQSVGCPAATGFLGGAWGQTDRQTEMRETHGLSRKTKMVVWQTEGGTTVVEKEKNKFL